MEAPLKCEIMQGQDGCGQGGGIPCKPSITWIFCSLLAASIHHSLHHSNPTRILKPIVSSLNFVISRLVWHIHQFQRVHAPAFCTIILQISNVAKLTCRVGYHKNGTLVKEWKDWNSQFKEPESQVLISLLVPWHKRCTM